MELTALIPVISILIAIASFWYARKKETKDDSVQQTQVIIEIRAMREDISEIKGDFKSLRAEMKQDHDDIVAMKRDFKTMWTRIDELKEMMSRK